MGEFLGMKSLGERHLYIPKVRKIDALTSAFALARGSVGESTVKESVFSVQACTVGWEVREKYDGA